MRRLEKEVAVFLKEDQPYQIERKYLIRMPHLNWLESTMMCRKIRIDQTYLKSEPSEEIRVRRRGEDGVYIYYETHKRTLEGMKRISFATHIVSVRAT